MPWEPRSLIPRADPDATDRRVASGLFVASSIAVCAAATWWWRGDLGRAVAFTAAVMLFFAVHELGHWLAARHHGIAVGLPWFLPVGVIMRLRDLPRTRTGLLELGAAGPLAGLGALAVLALVHFALGPAEVSGDAVHLAAPLLWTAIGAPFAGGVPAPPSAGDPLALAVCVGCLVTAANLLPFGQLDGGHVAAALIPERAGAVGWVLTACLLAGGLWWPGWAVWAAMLHLLGTRRALTARHSRPPSTRARRVALVTAVAFALCFTPAPIRWG